MSLLCLLFLLLLTIKLCLSHAGLRGEEDPDRGGPEAGATIIITDQKLTLTPRGTNFQRANVWGPGDFGSLFSVGVRVSVCAVKQH